MARERAAAHSRAIEATKYKEVARAVSGRYAAGNRRPTVKASADKDSGGAPLTVNFDASGSSDQDEDALVTAVIDASRSNGPGACGMSSTLEAVWLRQVRTLIVADGLSASGSECPVDARLYPDPPGPCPMCGAETLPVGDIVDRAAQQTIEQDGDVEIVHDRAAQRLRDACDGMGAVLRFRLHA